MDCGSVENYGGGVLIETRDTPPANYVLKVKSFSLFAENGVDHIKSNSFQVGEHKWKIILFPKGKNGGKDDHVSIYLIRPGTPSRFDSIKCEWGLDKFISLEDFEEPANGHLVNDTSFFGVEVFVSGGSLLGECHSISKVANISGKYKWVVTQFSNLGEDNYSDEFVVGGYKWKLWLYPEGNSKYKGFSLSLYLVSVDSKSSTTEHKVKAEFVLILKDQFKQNHIQNKTITWFGSSRQSWGWPSFIKLKDLKDDEKGYIVAEQCIIEAEVTVLCEGSRETLKCQVSLCLLGAATVFLSFSELDVEQLDLHFVTLF